MMTENIRSMNNGNSLQPVVVIRGHMCTKRDLLAIGDDAIEAMRAQSDS